MTDSFWLDILTAYYSVDSIWNGSACFWVWMTLYGEIKHILGKYTLYVV